MVLPSLYVIADAELLKARGMALEDFAQDLRGARVALVQWRDKLGSPQEVLGGAALLQEIFSATGCRLMMNDRADLALLARFDGVHLGQSDLVPEDARRVVGTERWVGASTHTDQQVRVADLGCADYVAIGPVFATGTKVDADPVVGLDGVRRARALTSKPLVAIGGITLENAPSVREAGADSLAVISGLFHGGKTVGQVAEDFLRKLR